jgi:hypothetical protein
MLSGWASDLLLTRFLLPFPLLQSVAHLPWRMLTYKALNTFIDDLFSFVIKMPMVGLTSGMRRASQALRVHV